MKNIPKWVNDPRKLAGALLIGIPIALYAGVVGAAVARSQDVAMWPLLSLCGLGVIVIMGWRVDRFRAGKGGLDIDIDEAGEEEE